MIEPDIVNQTPLTREQARGNVREMHDALKLVSLALQPANLRLYPAEVQALLRCADRHVWPVWKTTR